jgi:MFS family permease
MLLSRSRTTLGGPVVWRLATGLLLSRTGDQLTTIALLWLVLDLTGSGAAVGLVLVCAGLPPVVTGPLLGRVLDRWSPRRVMVADNLLRALLVAAIPALHWLGRLDMPLVYGLSLASGALIQPPTWAPARSFPGSSTRTSLSGPTPCSASATR